jgi:hypothetical protein
MNSFESAGFTFADYFISTVASVLQATTAAAATHGTNFQLYCRSAKGFGCTNTPP